MAVPAIASPTKNPDEWGAVASAITTILGALGLAAKLDLTADQVAIILGAVATLLSSARAIGRRVLAARGQ